MVTDRRTQNLAPGALAVLEDGDRRPLGLVTVNTKSKIIARMLDRDPEAQIDQAWFEARLSRALALRARLHDAPFYRLVHAEADLLPGVVIDRFGDVNDELAGFLDAGRAAGWKVTHTVSAHATPGAVVSREAFDHIAGII